MPVALLSPEELESIVEKAVRKALGDTGSGGDVISTEEAARIANRSVARVRAWIDAGDLPAIKRGRIWAVRREDLDRYLSGEKGAPVEAIVSSLTKS